MRYFVFRCKITEIKVLDRENLKYAACEFGRDSRVLLLKFFSISSLLIFFKCDLTFLFILLQNCVGALDGAYIPARVVGREVASYRN